MHYNAKPISVSASHAAFETRELTDAATAERVAALFPSRAERWPPPRWQRADLLAVAWANSTDLAIARSTHAAAQASQRASRTAVVPALSLQTEYARREQEPWLYGLGLDIPIGTGPRRTVERALADAATEATRIGILDAAWQVRRRVIAAASARIAAQRQVQAADALLALQQQRVALLGQRITAGEDDAFAVLPAQESLRRDEALRADAVRALLQADSDLARALGVPAHAIDALDIDWSDWGEPSVADVALLTRERENALLSRTDLALAINAYAIAELELQGAVAAQRPAFTLSPGYEWDHGIVKLPLALGITFTLPAHSRARIDERIAARERAGQQLLAIQAGIHADIDAALAAEALARANAETAQRRIADAQELQRQRALALKLGAIDSSESLATEIVAGEAYRDALQRRAEHQAARLALEDALRAPLSGDELRLPDDARESGERR